MITNVPYLDLFRLYFIFSRFWEMLAYLANTLIFILVGVAIMERAFSDVTFIDMFYITIDYFGITVIR